MDVDPRTKSLSVLPSLLIFSLFNVSLRSGLACLVLVTVLLHFLSSCSLSLFRRDQIALCRFSLSYFPSSLALHGPVPYKGYAVFNLPETVSRLDVHSRRLFPPFVCNLRFASCLPFASAAAATSPKSLKSTKFWSSNFCSMPSATDKEKTVDTRAREYASGANGV